MEMVKKGRVCVTGSGGCIFICISALVHFKEIRNKWMEIPLEKERVCVTGAGGYQASWLVKLLLSKGYMVHGTVRDPSDEKNAHLLKLENALNNLRLFKADLLDYDGLYTAIEGCNGVFHVASPARPYIGPNPEVEIIEPAVKGTLNVLTASSATKVKKVVVVSSIAAVIFNPNWPKDQVMDESCWSDKELCKNIESWYALSKTEAENQAWEYAKTSDFDLVTVCPSVLIGPMLQPTINGSSEYVVNLLKGELPIEHNKFRMFVDVYDTAEALLLVYEKPEAEGRYICSSYTLQDLVDKFKSLYPNYNYPNIVAGVDEDIMLSSEKLKNLGWKYRPLEETLVDSIKCCQERGLLPEVYSQP